MNLKARYAAEPVQAGQYGGEETTIGEAMWIRRAQDDIALFGPLYEAYYDQIFRFVYRRMESMDEAEILTAQVFLKSMTKLKQYEQRELPFSSWLYRIAMNEINFFYRRKKKEPFISVGEEALTMLGEEIVKDELEPYYAKMLDVLSGLKYEDIQLIQMRFFEKMHFSEIAGILGITENNAKVKTYRILEKMKKLILAKQ